MSKSEVPKRDHMDDPKIKWKTQKPDYTLVNDLYMKERTRKHQADSVEKLVENLVKTWEMESTHKTEVKDWNSVDRDSFYISANGGWKATVQDNIDYGNYNILMHGAPLYDPEALTNSESKDAFKTAFPDGFAWELLDLLAGPPVVVFTWRHWASWTGPFLGREPTGETINMIGTGVVGVTDDLKIKSIDIYYDPNEIMAKMLKFNIHEWKGCPFGKKK